jgi:uncharacterized protein (TIGR00255 family)
MTAALKSMTGFAQARVEQDGWAVRVHVRSVNHRLHLRLPEGFESMEPRIRQVVRDSVRRGHVDVILHLEAAGSSGVQINRELASAYLKAAEELRREFGLQAEPELAAVLRLPGVIVGDALPAGADLQVFAVSVESCLADALSRLEEMRRAEGRALAEEMSSRLGTINDLAAKIEELASRIRPAYAVKLEKRLAELLGESPVDPVRLAMEAALIAERGDISEEILRLRSHVQQFQKLLAAGGEAGKKIDFLLQEMQREANTMLSKTPGVDADGLKITEHALEVKSQIEKLREQAQNIE